MSMADFQKQIDAARLAYGTSPRYRAGYDELKSGADRKTFGIDVGTFDPTKINYGKPSPADPTSWHGNKIEVHGDEELRDFILAVLCGPGGNSGVAP